jgi:NAD(P)-dependent dehydrogenase (short-subunit alcohol dehydrogenase family)
MIYSKYKCHASSNTLGSLLYRCINSKPPTGDLAAAFEKHVSTYGGLDICIASAGIANPIPFDKDQTDGTGSWRRTLNVNFIAVFDTTRLAVSLKSDLVFVFHIISFYWILSKETWLTFLMWKI